LDEGVPRRLADPR
jgi:nucleotide-binding universal stress UspA family protein